MADLPTSIAHNHAAVAAFIATVTALPATTWATPVAPGKWSPGQLTEHLALTYEFGCLTLHGMPPGKGLFRPLRPFVRLLFLNPVLKTGRFTRPIKAPPLFDPAATPPAQAEGTARLLAAATKLETASTTAYSAGQRNVDHPFFGVLTLARFMDLQVIHTQHHHQHIAAGRAG